MCFMNVLGLDFSWVLEINSLISELKTPVSWAVRQMKGNSLKSAMFFTVKLENHFTLHSNPISFALWPLSTRSVFVGVFVLHGNRNQTGHQTQCGPCPGVLGLLPVEPQSGLGWRGPRGWPSSSPARVGSLSVSQAMASDVAAPRDGLELLLPLLPSVAEKHSRVMSTALRSEGEHRNLYSVYNS